MGSWIFPASAHSKTAREETLTGKRKHNEMNNLLTARSLMGLTLAFHIIFAAIGVCLPLLMTIAEWRWLCTNDPAYLLVAKRWAKGTAILFAVGAVSGTVLSFELGLLWPRFMEHAGALVGMPFSLEGFAFFTEAIFLGIYLYGWDRVPAPLHLASGALVAISGALSAVFVTFVNAWMNTPTGFDLVDGKFVNIHPFAAMLGPAAVPQVVHMVLAAYAAAGFAAAGIHGWLLLRRGRNRFDEVAIAIALTVGGVAVLAQAVSGDALARMDAVHQPMKLASLEGQFHTEKGAPLRIGGLPYPNERETKYALEIPYGLSLLAFHRPDSVVAGLDQEPQSLWPNVRIVHISFQIMVGCGSLLALFSLIAGWLAWKRRPLTIHRAFLKALVLISPLGFLALEAGWMVTELGRQPWVIYKIMRTDAAVTTTAHLTLTFFALTGAYFVLGITVVWLLSRHVIGSPKPQEVGVS
jgi:cytochrome d ubiquinol oxidase subunit I